jgi:hypothetical protein
VNRSLVEVGACSFVCSIIVAGHALAQHRMARFFEMLIANGANVNCVDRRGASPPALTGFASFRLRDRVAFGFGCPRFSSAR